MGYIYLAAPYTHDDPKVMKRRVKILRRTVDYCTAIGETVLSPVLYYRPVAKRLNKGGDFYEWEAMCLNLLSGASSMAVLKLEGWKNSVGVIAEIKYCSENGIPHYYWNA